MSDYTHAPKPCQCCDELPQVRAELAESERSRIAYAQQAATQFTRLTGEMQDLRVRWVQETQRADRAEQKGCVMCGHEPGRRSYGR